MKNIWRKLSMDKERITSLLAFLDKYYDELKQQIPHSYLIMNILKILERKEVVKDYCSY